MNKAGGIAIGGGGGVGSGPTTSAAAAAAQKQKALMVRVETDIANIVDNFTHLVNAARINDTPVRNSQEACTMDMRASRMAQAADSLLKLVSELKQTAIFSGFASLNDHVDQRISEFTQLAEKTDNLLARIGEEAAASLKELETHYYSSAQRTTQTLEPISCQGWSRVAPSMASKPVKGPDSFEMSCIPPEEAERETKKVEGFSKSMDANIICNNSLYQEPKTKDPIGKYSADSGYGSPRKTGLVKITENVNSDRHLDPKKKDPLSRPAGNASANQRSLPSLRTPRKSQLSTTSEAAGATTTAALPANMKANEAKTFSSITNRANLSGSRSTRSNSLESSGGSNKPHTGGDVRWDAIQLATARGTIGLSNFRLLKRLGYGDIGSVYLVELRGTNGHFAMKVMDKASLASRNKILRAQTEREILGLLDHPFLPTLYTYFETDKFCCIVMEFCSGGNLHSLRQKQPNKHFTEEAARFYASEVLLALEYLHMLGVVYRDLKPENVLVRDEGHIMLSDFDLSLRCSVSPTLVKSSSVHVSNNGGGGAGILEDESAVQGCIQPSTFFPRILPGKKSRKSKSDYGLFVGGSMPELMAEPTNVRSMSFVGTHEYLAPEIIRGEGHGSAVDWWTFGIFLYELLHGATPFKGQGNRATLFNVVGQPLKFPENPQVSMAARDLIRGLLVKEPHKRIAYKRGATEIKQHPFFEGVNWALVRSALPPHVPEPVDFSQYASKEAPPADRKTPDIGGDNKNGSSPENKDESYIEFEYF